MKTKLKRLLAVLLTLCLALSIVPMTAFAAEIDFLPQGVTYLNDLKHTYHTQVNVTANVSVKDSNGAVVETKQVTKSSEEFLEGGVGALQAKLAALQAEIETPYQASGTVTRGDGAAQTIVDHFETASFYTFTPASGDPVKFSTDLDAAKQYFSEHPDATGTFTKLLDMHEYQKYNYTYDLTVQENSQPASTITSAVVQNVKFNYQPGDAPQATAEVYNADADKYEIDYECWQQFKGNEPVAAWYSDNGAHGSLPTITEFESGEKYVYFLMLKAKNGRTFAATDSGLTVTVNGWTVEQQNISMNLDGQSVYVTGIATITPTKPVEPKEIEVIEINNATLTFKDGDKPVFTGTVPENDQYAFRCEWWSLDENTGIVSTEPEWGGDIYNKKITAFESGKTYHYGVYVTAYTADISPDAKLKINGQEVKYTRIGDESDTQSFWVETDLTMTPAADGHTHNYGTDWKYDSTNHWHECSCGDKSDLTAHSFKWLVDKEATATEKGAKHEECTVCGYKKAAVEIPATGSATKPTEPEKPADKSKLKSALEKAKALTKADYTEETWNIFAEALEKAQRVAGNENAAQEEVDGAVSGLESAMAQLEKVDGGEEKPSVEELKALVEKAEELNKDNYVASTWDNFAQALEAAKAVLDLDDATQTEIEAAKENLQKAMEALLSKTGWQVINGQKYYYGKDGIKKTGWQEIDGKKYYFGEENDGAMKTYWQKIDDKWYFFGNDGVMRTYWQKIWGKWYFLGRANDGAMKTSWQKIWGKWYYLGSAEDGSMKTYWQQINGKWYFFGNNNDGAMKSDWQQIWGKWYYLGSANDGAMKTGWQKINGKWYYFGGEQDGSMKSNVWVGDYYLDNSGVWSKTKKSK